MKKPAIWIAAVLLFLCLSSGQSGSSGSGSRVDRLTAHDAPHADVFPPSEDEEDQPQVSTPKSYFDQVQWVEIQRLIDSERVDGQGDRMSIEQASELLGLSIPYSPREMLPLAPPGRMRIPTEPCPDSMFSQPAQGPTDAWTAGTSDEGAGLQRFESYSVPADICSIRWWGLNARFDSTLGFTPCDRTDGGVVPDRYNIIFYPDDGGTPDLASPTCQYLGATVDGSTLAKTPTGLFYNTSFELFQYDLDLSGLGCCSLRSGWFSIQGVDDGQDCLLLQMDSATGDASSCLLDTTTSPSLDCGPPDNDYDLSVCLIGDVAPGACCNQDTGVCVDDPAVDYFDCMVSAPNVRFNPGGLCTDFDPPCGVNPGACCLPDGSCQELSSATCASSAGVFAGEGIACANVVCNETCPTAAMIPSVPFSSLFDNSLAAADGAPGSCNSSSATVMQNDVWYRYAPTEDCRLGLNVDPDFGAGYDGIMQLYSGPDCDHLTPLSGLPGDDGSGCFDLDEPWSTQFSAFAGETYWFQVGDWGTAAGGGLTSFELTCTPFAGACCTGSGCSVQTQSDCEAMGGTYLGDDTVCSGLDCNGNGVDDECDIASGYSEDCNGNGIPDECDLVGAGSKVALTEVEFGSTDRLEIQNVSGAALDTDGWMVAISDTPYSDPNTVNPIIQMLPATLDPDEIFYWTDDTTDHYWGNNIFWNPGDYPLFSGWAIILDDTGAVVDFAAWNGMPETDIAGLVLNIGPHTVTIGEEWIGDGIVTPDPPCGLGFSVQRVRSADHNDASDWRCQESNIGVQNPDLVLPFGVTGDPDCNDNGVPDECDIASGYSEDCNGNGIPDECDISIGAGSTVAFTEFDLGSTDRLEIQNVSGAALDTDGWMVAISDTPYSDPNTVNPIIQMLPATLDPDEIFYWTDDTTDRYWGNNLFWNPGDYPLFSGWAVILDDTGAVMDFAVWNGMPETDITDLVLNIGPYTVTTGEEWIGDGIVTPDPPCGPGFSVQRVGDTDHNDASDWLCQATNLGALNPGLVVPLGGTGDVDCNGNGVPDECDIAPGYSQDCNGNGVPDECDIASGHSEDCNGNGLPDECDITGYGIELYSQAVIPDDTGVGPGLLLAIGSSCPFNNTAAEDFAVASPTDITRITWEGVYFGATSDFPGVDNNFHVTFYEDNGSGNVGTVVADFPSVSVTKAPSSRPAVFGTNPVYTYSSVLPAPVPVNGGQRYWLSINGDPVGVSGPIFGWMASNEGNAASISGNDQPLQNDAISCATLPALTYTPGGIDGDQDADLAFALFGGTSGSSEDCNGNGVPDECDIADGTSTDCNSNGIPDECEPAGICGKLDVKPGSCPNSLKLNPKGYLSVGLLGTAGFDVTMIDLSTLRLQRADGVGGEVAPHEGPPGPRTTLADVGTPFDGLACDCHELEGDGVLDVSMRFRAADLVSVLELQTLPDESEVELVISGNLLDGTSFVSPTDCIRIVQPRMTGGPMGQ